METTLFKINASWLSNHCTFFQNLLFDSKDIGLLAEGASTERPIVVPDCTVDAFANFCGWLYSVCISISILTSCVPNLDLPSQQLEGWTCRACAAAGWCASHLSPLWDLCRDKVCCWGAYTPPVQDLSISVTITCLALWASRLDQQGCACAHSSPSPQLHSHQSWLPWPHYLSLSHHDKRQDPCGAPESRQLSMLSSQQRWKSLVCQSQAMQTGLDV